MSAVSQQLSAHRTSLGLVAVAGVAAAAAAELSRTNQVSAAAGLGAVAGGAGAVAIAIPVVKFATGFAKDRLEDAKASSMLPEDVNRMHKVRRWRQQLSAEEAQAWADYGFDLRRLDPPAYSQGLEAEILQRSGNMVCKYEKLWAELPTDAANAAPQWQHREYRFVAAILSPSFLNGTGLGIPEAMALKLGVSQGDQIHYSVGGQEFLGPIRVLPTPTEAQLRAAALQGEHSHLAGEALDRRIAELRAEHQRYVVVPLGGIQRLMTAGISVQMPARAAA